MTDRVVELVEFPAMEIQLIQLYLLVCHIYDTRSETCFQRFL